MAPYIIVDEDETHITYEYRTAYTWLMFAALLAVVAGIAVKFEPLSFLGAIIITTYFIFLLGSKVTREIQSAMKSGSVTVSGSKTSFSDPLRICVPK